MAITKDDVSKAVDTLKNSGVQKPSAGKVRELLGTGGMSTIQKYLNEIRNDEVEQELSEEDLKIAEISKIEIDEKLISSHVSTIIENVSAAVRSEYLQKIISDDARILELEAELELEKSNYAELASDFDEQANQNKSLIDTISEYQERVMDLEMAAAEEAEQSEAIAISTQHEIEEFKAQHEKEILSLKAANNQLTMVIESITKRIGVVQVESVESETTGVEKND